MSLVCLLWQSCVCYVWYALPGTSPLPSGGCELPQAGCGSGYMFDGRTCVSMSSHSCPTGLVMSALGNVCEKPCGPGTMWNGVECVARACPFGSRLLGDGKCKPLCRGYEVWTGSRCVLLKCPPGVCCALCVAYDVWYAMAETMLCLAYRCLTGSVVGEGGVGCMSSCGSGTVWNGESCMPNGDCMPGEWG
jgi:hypothetical protein